MKLLSLHCDYIKFKPVKKALKEPEELSENDKKEKQVKEALVILTSVEKGDDIRIVEEYLKNIKDIAKQVKAKNIVLYPYAHLSSNLSLPEIAENVLKEAELALKKDKEFSVTRAPFGYYKEFELKCKGHPLSELSRSIGKQETGTEGKTEVHREKEYDVKQLLKQISRSKLDTSKLKENDHRILGMKMDLFSFNETAPGMVFFHNNGLIIYNELVKFWREEHRKAGYLEISTPFFLDKKIWQISGHWEKYRENIFLTKYEERDFAVKPMNCPGGMLVYKTSPKSYKDLPLRVGELGIVHRQELSGVLAGLFRVIKFTQDDAHIFCTEEHINNEVMGIVQLIDRIYKKFNLPFHIEFSTRPPKRIGTDKEWDVAEKLLEDVLKKNKLKFKLNPGEGAFYGPKIDFHIKDSQGRTWQTATIQLDFAMPERFDLTYTDRDNKEKRPVMLHRTIFGSLERFIGILLEHLNGNLPVWLSPVQARVLSFIDRNVKSAEKLANELKNTGIRADADLENSTIESKVRNASMQHIPYIIVLGDKEEKAKTLAVRTRDGKVKSCKLEEFLKKVKREIAERE